jgi:CDP-paratose 2-epimerase
LLKLDATDPDMSRVMESNCYLITGGCGFVGSNLAAARLGQGHAVVCFDNLSRAGSEKNLDYLRSLGHPAFTFVEGDIRDPDAVARVIGRHSPSVVYHLAAQVAVTTSVEAPRRDFEINATGTLNVLEAVRESGRKTPVFFTSTNKVYGGMEHLEVVERDGRYDYASLPAGVAEDQPLDFHSPYGCSKGAADQYVRDYARIYAIPTVVFRMSCQYGPRQFGNEDQGWVAHFVIAAAKGHDIIIYGDGKQVRDVLYVDDLVAVFSAAEKNLPQASGRVYNIGGGRHNVISLLDLIRMLETATGRNIQTHFGDWRPGDQRVYISDITRARADLNWEPRIPWTDGVRRLLEWVRNNPALFGD